MSTGFLDPGVESVNARLLMGEKFPEQQGAVSTANIVVYNEAGLTAEDEAFASRIAGSVQGGEDPGDIRFVMDVFDQPELRPSLVSADNTTMLIPVGLGTEAFDSKTGETVTGIRERLPAPPAGTPVFVSGDAGLGGDHLQACIDAISSTALITLTLITIILLAVYRSPIAPLVPLFTIGLSALVGLGIIGLLMRAGVEFSSFLQEFMILIVFGAGTDYVLFMVSRYREELAKGVSPHQAVIGMMDRVGVVIASSATVVIGAFAVIGFSGFEMFRTIGPGLAIAVAVTLLAGLTFTPALMSAVRPQLLFWPARGFGVSAVGSGTQQPRVWKRLGSWVGRAPQTVFGLGAILLILPLIALPSLNRTFELDKDLSDSYESVQGHQVVAAAFDLSEMMPLNVMVASPAGLSSGPGMQAIAGLSGSLAGLDGVTQVRSATRPEGELLALAPEAIAQDPGMQAILPYYVSEDGSTTRLSVGLSTSAYSNETYDQVGRVRDEAQRWAARSAPEDTTVLVGGASAEIADLIDAMDGDTPLVVFLVTIVTFIILALLLRSLIAPLYILASIFLTVLTTLAVTALIFQGVLDFRYDGVDWVVPVMLFVLLVVLAADYSIFLMSRVKEEAETHGLRSGVERGVTHTGGVITACGLILAGTFAALVFAPVGSLIQMGFAISFGVLLDTFVV
ncbi:MAG: MMPL family transporter, partial [Chloroflexota bacterium]